MNYRLSIALLPLLLTACGGDTGTQLVPTDTPTLGAASIHPCNEEYEFQAELNGAADFVDSEEDTVDGEVIITERHVYSSAQLVVHYTFAQGGGWCNAWTEGGGE